ncbi:MAG: BON domain-containing protein [Promethearchaeia archaeon]
MSEEPEVIKKEIVDQLYWDPKVDASRIEVKVDGRKVYLTGEVPNPKAKQSASDDCWLIKGVKFVDNRLEVKHHPALKVKNDTEIKGYILEAFDLNETIDKEKIDVSVVNGIVTLKGEIDSYWKKEQAFEIISELEGVKKIYNNITAVPTGKYTDEEIKNEIISAMQRNNQIDANNVEVRVDKGKVILSGEVKNWRALSAAQDAAKYTAGVIDLQNNLKVQ